jgi:opacity protein-like surface antigen
LKSALGLAALALAALLAPAASASAAAAPSVDEMIAKHIAARGGLAALQAIKAVRMTGSMRPGGFDVQLAYDETIARPGSVRIDATLQGLTLVQSYDGASGWQIQPFQGRKDPESLSADDTKALQEEADFEGPLIDAKAKGATIEDLGNADVDGAPTWALRATLKNGDQLTYYLDPDAWLTVRIVTRQLLRGAETLTQTDFGDYEKVAGVYFPFEIASGPKGSTVQQRITYDKIVANPTVDPATFERPKMPVTATAQATPVPTKAAPQTPVPDQPRKPPVTPPPAS